MNHFPEFLKSCREKKHSQIRQDEWVLCQLHDENPYRGQRPLHMVEIGCHDGIQLSNTLFFEQELHARCLLVDANEHSVIKAVKNRNPRSSFFHAAVSNKQGTRFLETAKHPMLCETFDSQQVLKNLAEVTSLTITQILDHFEFPHHIDYMSIDVEGHEMEVLEGLDTQKYEVFAFTIEHNYQEEKASQIFNWLSERNYLVRTYYHDFFAVKDFACLT